MSATLWWWKLQVVVQARWNLFKYYEVNCSHCILLLLLFSNFTKVFFKFLFFLLRDLIFTSYRVNDFQSAGVVYFWQLISMCFWLTLLAFGVCTSSLVSMLKFIQESLEKSTNLPSLTVIYLEKCATLSFLQQLIRNGPISKGDFQIFCQVQQPTCVRRLFATKSVPLEKWLVSSLCWGKQIK
jgi:hypothetical protein